MKYFVFLMALLLGLASGGVFKDGGCTEESPVGFQREIRTVYRSEPSRHSRDYVFYPPGEEAYFSKSEAGSLLGKRIINMADQRLACPSDSGQCMELGIDAKGRVASIIKNHSETGYLIRVKWDTGELGNYQSTIGKGEPFEVY